MIKMGYEINEDGRTEWRNNGGVVERRALYASDPQWEVVAESIFTPHTAAELKDICEANGMGYQIPTPSRKLV